MKRVIALLRSIVTAGCKAAYDHNDAQEKSNYSFHNEKPP